MTISLQQWLNTAVGRRMDHTSGVGDGVTDCADVSSDIVISCIPGGAHLWANGIDCADVAAAHYPDYYRAENFSTQIDYPAGTIFSGPVPGSPYGHTGVLTRVVSGTWWAIQQDTYRNVPAWEGPVNVTITRVAVPTARLLNATYTAPQEDDMQPITYTDRNTGEQATASAEAVLGWLLSNQHEALKRLDQLEAVVYRGGITKTDGNGQTDLATEAAWNAENVARILRQCGMSDDQIAQLADRINKTRVEVTVTQDGGQ